VYEVKFTTITNERKVSHGFLPDNENLEEIHSPITAISTLNHAVYNQSLIHSLNQKRLHNESKSIPSFYHTVWLIKYWLTFKFFSTGARKAIITKAAEINE